MKTLIQATCIAALLATQAAAVIVEAPIVSEKPATEERSSSSNMGGTLAILGALALVVILANRKPQENEPRPLVQPQTCMNKHAVMVACPEDVLQ